MSETIKNGAGTGHLLRVDANNRAHVQAVAVPAEWNANKNGKAYNINSGIINLGTANDTPVLYLKNNEDEDLHINAIAVGLGPSTGGLGGIPKITIVRNPTSVDFNTAADVVSNRNYGSSETLTADVYKGADGDTVTGGEDHIIIFQTANGRLFAPIDEIIPKGSKIVVKIDPQDSNTSMDVYVAFICHLDDAENKD